MFLHDLRPLFLHDPFVHSGIYDSTGRGLVTRGCGTARAVKGRICIVQEFMDEPSLQAAIASLLVTAAGPSIADAPISEVAGRRLRGLPLVLSPETLHAYVKDPVDSWFANHPFSGRIPSSLSFVSQFLRKDRKVYLHPGVPRGLVLGVKGPPEEFGRLSTPENWPYPAGVGLFDSDLVRGFRVKPCFL
jgi:hypothetical protein